ncbi:DNA mismatch repair endonuclease MutL [Bacilli bacterium]|nr:DNA mismatch repair protein MutL [Bacilli bacterium VT-13-104]PZD87801.1 DNA mismatch repair endonuclease MutL [Bacilli bacterium]PZD88607.1 DNA mismatch repair endonuclease MutL [Bacilli bacterium]PZD89900.1 DNA mismatch repair endonuclease MutL [Bacilli bacterium]RCO05571.1 DNA mismatch repair endonuclease MutL [Bacilli bacterium]
MKIVQMSDALANKIAAGEVVERPASVVKELVENSIDANSTWIKVDIKEAGLEEIKVTDNGDGMSEEDSERAFLPHATSKIRNESDLFHVKTLGFRGEALASIASVSKLTVKSSEGDKAGIQLILEGGKIIDKKKSDARRGTEITVNDLFFNTPARLKYMKSLHTELGHITDLLNRLALSHPNIRFEATHNGKGLFKTAGTGDLLQVISQVYGMNVAKNMLMVKEENLDFHIEGFIAKPEITRASRNYISTIINGRYIKSIPLNQAIIRGYHTLLPIGRSPIVVLSINMDPILVDVNVHPTKLEVRFSKDKELYTQIEELIRHKFREFTLIPEMTETSKLKPKEKSYQHSMDFNSSSSVIESNDSVRETIGNWSKPADVEADALEDNLAPTNSSSPKEDIITSYEVNKDEIKDEYKNEELSFKNVSKQRVPMMYPIGQLQGTYILAQNENGLYMIDQHAAQERIKYEFFRDKLGKPANELQELLLPMTFEFSKQESLFIEQYKEEMEKVGIFFEAFGNQTYIIRSHPNWFPNGFEEEVIREMVEQIMNEEKINVESIREDAAILMSCKRSIKANHYLNQDEMFRLLEDLRNTTDPFTCPHGRPIIVHFSTYELEKMFKRVM